jgi:hypothetical protein
MGIYNYFISIFWFFISNLEIRYGKLGMLNMVTVIVCYIYEEGSLFVVILHIVINSPLDFTEFEISNF